VAPQIRVHRASTGDLSEIERFAEAFDNPVIPQEAERFLADPRHTLLLGYLDDRPAGLASAVEVFHPDKQPQLFLNEIGVIPTARRHGIATALIQELEQIAQQRSCTTIWVLSDEQNPPAMALYRSTGGHRNGQHQVMFEYHLAEED
jgi:aminoglycoside 6'-N-acetyltransferase I